MVYYIKWYLDVEPTLHSWDKSHLVIMCHSSYMLLDATLLWQLSLITYSAWVEPPLHEAEERGGWEQPQAKMPQTSTDLTEVQ